MALQMNAKHKELMDWLRSVLGDVTIPTFEVNPETLSILNTLKESSEWRDKSAAVLSEDWHEKAVEYESEALRLQNILGRLSLTPDALSQSGTSSLQTLSRAALLLQVNEASDTNMLLAMCDQSKKLSEVTDACRSQQHTSAELLANTKSVLSQCNTLNRAVEVLDEQSLAAEPEFQRKAQQSEFLRNKAAEYRSQLQQLEAELSSSGVDQSIYHTTLQNRAQELKDIRNRIHPIKVKLDSYKKLPPDIDLVRGQVEESKRELAALDEQLLQHMNLMHM